MKQTYGGQILQSDPDGRAFLKAGTVVVQDDRIASVEFGPISTAVDVGGPETLLIPGLIDAHLHLPQFDSIGVAGMPLLPWLKNVIFPAEAKWNDLDYARAMIARVIDQCLAHGTTGICAFATSAHPATIEALGAFERAGFQGVIGQVLMDRDGPAELLHPAERLIDEADETLSRYPANGRLAAAVTPRFALSCSDRLMEQAGALAKSHRSFVQTHLAETVPECEAVRERFGDQSYVSVYEHAGLTGDRSLFAHAIHLDDDSLNRMAQSASIAVHCPTANAFLSSGVMHRHRIRSRSIPIALGSDIGAGFERSMVRVGRSMIDAAQRIAFGNGDAGRAEPDLEVPSAAEAWHQVTAGNADALGWSDGGRIRAGASADLLVVRPDICWNRGACPLSTLMFAWDDRWIKQTVLRGQVRFRSSDSG